MLTLPQSGGSHISEDLLFFPFCFFFAINWNRLSVIFNMHSVIWQENRDMFMKQHHKKHFHRLMTG